MTNKKDFYFPSIGICNRKRERYYPGIVALSFLAVMPACCYTEPSFFCLFSPSPFLLFRFLHHVTHGLFAVVASALSIKLMDGRNIALLPFLPPVRLMIDGCVLTSFTSFTHNSRFGLCAQKANHYTPNCCRW